jgi:hypothetical protein
MRCCSNNRTTALLRISIQNPIGFFSDTSQKPQKQSAHAVSSHPPTPNESLLALRQRHIKQWNHVNVSGELSGTTFSSFYCNYMHIRYMYSIYTYYIHILYTHIIYSYYILILYTHIIYSYYILILYTHIITSSLPHVTTFQNASNSWANTAMVCLKMV